MTTPESVEWEPEEMGSIRPRDDRATVSTTDRPPRSDASDAELRHLLEEIHPKWIRRGLEHEGE